MGETKKAAAKPAASKSTPKAKTWDEIYKLLAEDLPEAAIEKTSGSKTGKGYDTTGYKYQYVVNRFNHVCGVNGWGFTYEEIERRDGKSKRGSLMVAVTMDTHIWIQLGEDRAKRSCSGGHTSNNYADARKGAITNSFKKTAALFGVGRKAYEVSIDDDSQPVDVGVESPNRTAHAVPRGPVLASEKQVGMISVLLDKCGMDREAFKKKNGWTSFKEITVKQASDIIKHLQTREQKLAAEAAQEEAAGPDDVPTVNYDEGEVPPEEAPQFPDEA